MGPSPCPYVSRHLRRIVITVAISLLALVMLATKASSGDDDQGGRWQHEQGRHLGGGKRNEQNRASLVAQRNQILAIANSARADYYAALQRGDRRDSRNHLDDLRTAERQLADTNVRLGLDAGAGVELYPYDQTRAPLLSRRSDILLSANSHKADYYAALQWGDRRDAAQHLIALRAQERRLADVNVKLGLAANSGAASLSPNANDQRAALVEERSEILVSASSHKADYYTAVQWGDRRDAAQHLSALRAAERRLADVNVKLNLAPNTGVSRASPDYDAPDRGYDVSRSTILASSPSRPRRVGMTYSTSSSNPHVGLASGRAND